MRMLSFYLDMKFPPPSLIIGFLIFGLGRCLELVAPTTKNYPIISMQEVNNTSHDKFNVRGYIVAVVECGSGERCVSMDGIHISTKQISLVD